MHVCAHKGDFCIIQKRKYLSFYFCWGVWRRRKPAAIDSILSLEQITKQYLDYCTSQNYTHQELT